MAAAVAGDGVGGGEHTLPTAQLYADCLDVLLLLVLLLLLLLFLLFLLLFLLLLLLLLLIGLDKI